MDEAKERLQEYDGDLEHVLEAEKEGKNRKTLIAHIEGLMERRSQDEESGGKPDMSKLKEDIERKLDDGEVEEQIKAQREPAEKAVEKDGEHETGTEMEYIKTGIDGLDRLFTNGIPKSLSVIVAGGTGSGKTILTLQMMAHHANHGDKCLYISFEESEKQLISHMRSFGWEPEELIESGNLVIKRYSTFDVARDIEAMMAAQKGELTIEVEPTFIPETFEPDFIVVDSLTAIASAFAGKEDAYRLYIEQLFRYFEKIDSTNFLITETEEMPEIFSPTGVEEFLADGVIVLYNIRRSNVRESAIEVLKMRGEKHEKKIVAMQITGKGITVYPEQEVFAAT